jgi:signal transduction histidine kinase
LKRILAKRSVLEAFGATALCLCLVVAWTRELRPGWLLAAMAVHIAASVGSARVLRRRPRALPGALTAALGLLLVGLGLATIFSWQFQRLERDWSGVVERRHAGLGTALSRQMTVVVARGREVTDMAARAAATDRGEALFRRLDALREQGRVDALSIYTAGGDLLAWAGEHRGPLPDSIWLHEAAVYFEERPLFSYLYFLAAVPGREEQVVAAVLVETGIIGGGVDGAYAAVVAAPTGTRASFRRGSGEDAVWALAENGDTIVHARLEPLTQAEWRGKLNRGARRALPLAVLASFIALSAAWLRWTAPAHSRLAAAAPLLLLVPILGFAPLRDTFAATRFFSPLLFTLPLPGDISLGRLLAVLLPVAAMAAGARRRARPARHALFYTGVGGLVVAGLYPVMLHVLLDAATPALLQSQASFWLGLQFTAVLALAVPTLALMQRVSVSDPRNVRWFSRGVRRILLAAALLGAALVALTAAAAVKPAQPPSLPGAALWAIPFMLATYALAPLGGRAGAIIRWLVACWLAGTAVLPYLWTTHVNARLAAAETEIETLGTRTDPYLEYLLLMFGIEAGNRFAAGEQGVQLLYRTWVASGLAQEPYAARVVLWSPEGFPDVQLGMAPVLSEHEANLLTEFVEEARSHTAPLINEFTDLPNVSKLLTVPLPDGSLITVVLPPRRSLDRTSAVAPFLGVVSHSPARLNLIEAAGPDLEHDTIQWVQSPGGWRSEAAVQYPDGWYHAHLTVPMPGPGVRFVRASLLLTFDLVLFALLWITGIVARGGAAVPRGDWTGWLGSFRARVTVALFAFFLVPTAVFGWAAYSALAGEVARAAERIAQHSVNQAVLEFDDAAGDLRRLATHAGTDVLRYHGGELIDVSSREAFDLGVYSAWMPPHIFLRLQSGEEHDALGEQTLGRYSFVTAYRAMVPTGTLGVPMSLSAGDAAVRLRELSHLVLFAAVIGALLSLALSVAVGRALAGPIGQLRRASAAVGAGSLRIRLPEHSGDEFGQLFTSFNRMTRRLRRARARERRTARVLAWGEMARQVAHEIKNPLTPIKLSVQHLRRAHRDRHPHFDEILDSNVSQILTEIDRLSEIARAFSRYGAPTDAAGPLTPVDVPAVIREALTLYRSGDRHVHYLDIVDPELPFVQARADELKEVLLNVVENARAALDGPGAITIQARRHEDRVEIEVSDNGPGVAPELLHRIFEPHFSTRSAGTGLGLAIVRRLVESWGGTVHAESEIGRGTTIRIRLQALERLRDRAGDTA